MNDDDFERTVEQLYGQTKPEDFPDQSTHVVELQPVRSGGGDDPSPSSHSRSHTKAIDAQPRPRRSMEAPGRRSGSRSPPLRPLGAGGDEDDREQAMLESRKDAKVRVREWVAAQGSSPDVSRLPTPPPPPLDSEEPPRATRSRSQSRTRAHRPQRSESGATTLNHGQGSVSRPGSAHAHRQRASEAHAVVRAGDGGSTRMSVYSQEQDVGAAPRARPDDPPSWRGEGQGQRRPRPGIPDSLMPGLPHSAAPTQLPFDLGPGRGRASSRGQAQDAMPSHSGAEDPEA
ncbi:hypothetical protein C8Q80DRAFT_1267241 [Daedaleopsis nitida]|nr:hypothetical protein C8Q80DRAFT_1267241 [Daedaleopsis nitida]